MFKLSRFLLPFIVVRATSAFSVMGRTTRSSACGISSDNKEVPVVVKKTVVKKKTEPLKKKPTKHPPPVPVATASVAGGDPSYVVTIEACKQ